MAIHWSSFFQAIQVSSVAIGTITFSTFPLFLTFMEPVVFKEKLRARSVISAVILLAGVYITVPEFSVENQVTVGILWGMLCSFTYAIMTLGNRYFSKKYTGRIICLYEQGTAAIVLLPALWLVKWSGDRLILQVWRLLASYARRLHIHYMYLHRRVCARRRRELYQEWKRSMESFLHLFFCGKFRL